jgi:hypothetical protein
MLYIVISINMCFIKFVVYKINFKMVKSSGMMLLTIKEKTDITDIDVAID